MCKYTRHTRARYVHGNKEKFTIREMRTGEETCRTGEILIVLWFLLVFKFSVFVGFARKNYRVKGAFGLRNFLRKKVYLFVSFMSYLISTIQAILDTKKCMHRPSEHGVCDNA